MKTLQSTALLIALLVLTLPIAAAQQLSLVTYAGKDASNGYAKLQDEVTIEAQASIPGEDIIDTNQVLLYVEQQFAPFDNCEQVQGGTYACTFFEPDFSALEPVTFTVQLKDDDGTLVKSETRTITVDNNAPAITDLAVEPQLTQGDVTVTYSAEDYALNFGDTSSCSGLKTITLTAGETTATQTNPAGTCTDSRSVDITLQPGTTQVCVHATDHINLDSPPICVDVRVDTNAPTIESLTILDQQGFEITHVKTGTQRLADISAVITDDGEIAQSFAKVQDLNPQLPNFIPPSIVEGDIHSWTGIPVSEVSPCNVQVKATDTLGNEAAEAFSCIIKADDQPPNVTGIIPHATKNGTPLYGYGTELVIGFTDQDNTGSKGIGLQSRKAYLDLSELGLGDFEQADACEQTGSQWQCKWLLLPPPATAEGTYEVTLSQGTSDDLENLIGQAHDFTIIYDNQGPRQPTIEDFKIASGEAGTETQAAIKESYIQYTVQSADFSTAHANFSLVGGSEEKPSTICETVEGTTKNCVFEQLVELSGPYTGEVTFTFLDEAGNKASTSTTLQVYGIDDETGATYWNKPTVECSPRLIDRSTASLVPQYVSCRVDLETPRDDISTVTVTGPGSPDDCTGDTTLTINDVYVTNNGEGSKNPYLFFKLEPRDFAVNNLSIACPLQVFSKREEAGAAYVSPQSQELNVNVTLQFYNNPLGDLHQNIEEEIESAMDDALANFDHLDFLKQILHYAQQICYLKSVYANVNAVLFHVTKLFEGVAAVTPDPFDVPTEGAKASFCQTEEKLAEKYAKDTLDFLTPICAMANCQATPAGKDADFFEEIGSGIGGGLGHCQDIKKWFNENLGQNLIPGNASSLMDRKTGQQLSGINVKDSLVLSTACLCLPGIIYNFEKLREVQCFRAVCLHDDVKEKGYPVSFCNEMHNYMICSYVVGEVFSLLPFTKFWNSFINTVTDALSDPITLATTIIGGICYHTCPMPSETFAYDLCATTKTIAVVSEAAAAVWRVVDSKQKFWEPVGTQYCDRMKEIKEEEQ